MLIFYDHMTECWIKQNDDYKEESLIEMTPENLTEDLLQEFDSEEDFWDWYNSK